LWAALAWPLGIGLDHCQGPFGMAIGQDEAGIDEQPVAVLHRAHGP
jgi:hypothetical protein